MTCKKSTSQAAGVDAGTKRARLANWDDQKDEILLGILKEQQLLGIGIAGHFPHETWRTIVEAFNHKTDLSYHREHLKNRLKVLKTTYGLYHAIVNNGGWEWDHVRNIPTPGSPSKWNEIIVVNPNYAKCKDKPFPRYRDIDFLYGKKIDEDSCKHSMPEADNLDVTRKSGCNLNSTAISNNAEAPRNQYEADSMQPKPQPASNPSPNPCPQGSEAFSEGEPSSSSSKQRITFAVPLSCRKRPRHESHVLAELVDIERQQLEIAQEKFNGVIASRLRVYSIEDCMKKLEKVKAISPETFVVACESFMDEDSRTIFMNLDGPSLAAWIERQMKKDMQRQFRQQYFSSFCGPKPEQTPISEKTASGPTATPPSA